MSFPSLPRVLRTLAIALVILALLDPPLPSGRHEHRVVAVLDAGESGSFDAPRGIPDADPAWADRVADRLAAKFTVVRGPYPGASATVLVGDHLPAALSDGGLFLPPPVFLVHPDRAAAPPRPRVVHLEAPRRVSPESAIPVRAWIAAAGPAVVPRGTPEDTPRPPVRVSLRAALLVGGVVVADTVLLASEAEGAPAEVRFEVVPTGSGPLPLRVEVTREVTPEGTREVTREVEGRTAGRSRPGDRSSTAGPPGTADLLVNVTTHRWNVLFFDGRPSWMSTFVRRALEPDPRFAVTSRTLTSPGIATQFGAPPVSLAAAGALAEFDAVLVGAPELLSEADAAALRAFMEMRGGSVFLLFDREAPGPHERLTGVTAWTRGGGAEPVPLTPGAQGGGGEQVLEARSLMWPATLPAGARAVAATPAGDPVLWRRPVGKGRLVVSGALDNWQFRDPETTDFEPFWRELVGEAADLAPGPLELEWIGTHEGGGRGHGAASGIAPPGGFLSFGATLRDTPAPGARVVATASLGASGAGNPGVGGMVPLWPTEVPGRFEGRLRAPVAPGAHLLEFHVEGGSETEAEVEEGTPWRHSATLPFVVLADAAPPPPDDPALMEAWAASRGGTLRASGELARLEAEILQAVGAEGPSDSWHPMRSPWWILPLALLLGGEWAWRRRRGLA